MEVSLVERGGAQRFPTVFWVTYTTYPSIKTSFLSLKKKKKKLSSWYLAFFTSQIATVCFLKRTCKKSTDVNLYIQKHFSWKYVGALKTACN